MIMRFDANAPLWRRLKTAREALALGIKVGPFTVIGDLDALVRDARLYCWERATTRGRRAMVEHTLRQYRRNDVALRRGRTARRARP